MKIILHTGMGKTGTTSIQHALASNKKKLCKQRVEYLGPWFDMLKPKISNFREMSRLSQSSEENLLDYGKQFASFLAAHAETSEISTFILSNEGLGGQAKPLSIMMQPVEDIATLVIVEYVRNPWSWMPSAYSQWGLTHKVASGCVESFKDAAPRLIKQYRQPLSLIQHFGDRVHVRLHEDAKNIVADFAEFAGIELAAPEIRKLKRAEESELLLRALYNDSIDGPVRPKAFEQSLFAPRQRPPAISTWIERFFDYDFLDEIINENKEVFDRIKSQCGIDLLTNPTGAPAKPQEEAIHKQMMSYLITLSIIQAKRIDQLESKLTLVEKAISLSDDVIP